MKYSTSQSHRHGSSGSRGSRRSALNPYLIDDIAMTRRELELARRAAITVVVPR